MLGYSNKLEWMNDWDRVVDRLHKIHGDHAKVLVYPAGKLQFDPKKYPLHL
jgi:hypothetical protein